MPKFSRDKGRRGEQEVVNILKAHDFDAHRTGEFVPHDVIANLSTRDWTLEVKLHANGFNKLYKFLNGSDALLCRSDRMPWLFVCPFGSLFELMPPRGK